ncbi:MAG: HEPN domain-containing protein [bacterium]|nr:HEPN domain-containing protein [Candidatus Margulisiibacteriota bacterium]
MTKKEPHKKILLIKAKEDLDTAEKLVQLGNYSKEIVAFHCQQAVEKALKAYLDSLNILYPKTHDLETLLSLCLEQDQSFEKIAYVTELTPFAIDIRYDEFVSLKHAEVENLVKQAKTALNFIIKKA